MAENINQMSDKDKKIRIAILVITLVLTMIFAVLSAVIEPNGPSDYPSNSDSSNKVSGTLSLNAANSIYISKNDDTVYYRFEPLYSGTYTFYSTNARSGFDPQATLYDSDWNTVKSNDDASGSSSYDFEISNYLYSGRTYYLGISLSSSSSSGSVTVYVSR